MNAWTATALCRAHLGRAPGRRPAADRGRPRRGARGARRGSVLVPHLRAQPGRGHLRAGIPRATTATGSRRSRRASTGSPCSTSGPSTASTPSSPRPGARSTSSPSTTSSTSSGSGRAGASSSREARASGRSTCCSTRRVEYRKLDALELDRLDERFDFIFCCGILHRVEAPGRLLRLLSRRLAEGGQGPDRDARRLRAIRAMATPCTATARGGLPPGRLRLLGVHRRRDRDARSQERVPALRARRRTGDRRPPADHRLAAALSACSPASQNRYERFAGISHPWTLAGVTLTITVAGDLIAHRLGSAYGPGQLGDGASPLTLRAARWA